MKKLKYEQTKYVIPDERKETLMKLKSDIIELGNYIKMNNINKNDKIYNLFNNMYDNYNMMLKHHENTDSNKDNSILNNLRFIQNENKYNRVVKKDIKEFDNSDELDRYVNHKKWDSIKSKLKKMNYADFKIYNSNSKNIDKILNRKKLVGQGIFDLDKEEGV